MDLNEHQNSQTIEEIVPVSAPKSYKLVKYMPMTYIVYIINAIAVFTLLGCYAISQQNFDYVKIFPRTLITLTGRFYPQSILFRFGLGVTSYPLLFMFSIVFLWIKRSAKIINYKGILCMKLQYVSYFGFFCEFITIGTMDVGETWLTHRVSAYTFYFLTFPILGLLTIVIRNMRKHENNFLNPFSYYSKVVMALYLLALNSFSLGVIVFFPVKKAIVIAINQWQALYILIFWFFSFSEDWLDIYLKFDTESMEFSIAFRQKQEKPLAQENSQSIMILEKKAEVQN